MALRLAPSGARLPYSGHLNVQLKRGPATLEIAARLAAGLPPERAWDALLSLQALLDNVDGEDRHGLMESLWRTLRSASPAELGPTRGADLSLMALAVDPEGVVLSGVGLASIEGCPQASVLPKQTGLPQEVPPSVVVDGTQWLGHPSEEGQ